MTTIVVLTSKKIAETLLKQGKITSCVIGRDIITHKLALLAEVQKITLTEAKRLRRIGITVTRFSPYYNCRYSKVLR